MTQSYDNWLASPYEEDSYCEECEEWYNEKKYQFCKCHQEEDIKEE